MPIFYVNKVTGNINDKGWWSGEGVGTLIRGGGVGGTMIRGGGVGVCCTAL